MQSLLIVVPVALLAACSASPIHPDQIAHSVPVEATAQSQQNDFTPGGRPMSAPLMGSQVVDGAGDPDGWGNVSLGFNRGQSLLCYAVIVLNIEPATAVSIHAAPAGQVGPTVAVLSPPTDGSSTGCVSYDVETLADIFRNPSDYYVSVFNAAYPAGAIRGQLED